MNVSNIKARRIKFLFGSILAAFFLFGARVHGGEISNYFENVSRHAAGFKSSKITDKSVLQHFQERPKTTILEVGIEQTGCHGTCAVYSFVIRNDGTASYEGLEHVPRIGKYAGNIDLNHFFGIAEAFEELGFMDLDDEYSAAITDMPTTYTMLTTRTGKKVVRNYAGLGPAKLKILERLLDGLVEKVQWGPPPRKRKGK